MSGPTVDPVNGWPATAEPGECRACGDCDGGHHWGDCYQGFASEDPEHPAAKAGHEGWWECKHCPAWMSDSAMDALEVADG